LYLEIATTVVFVT